MTTQEHYWMEQRVKMEKKKLGEKPDLSRGLGKGSAEKVGAAPYDMDDELAAMIAESAGVQGGATQNKYKIREDDSITIQDASGKDVTLYRVEATQSFGKVKAGQLGGYVEASPDADGNLVSNNLSQKGTCWIDKNVQVYGGASVTDGATVTGTVQISDGAKVNGNSALTNATREAMVVSGRDTVVMDSLVNGPAKIEGGHVFSSDLSGPVKISGTPSISASMLTDKVCITGDATVNGSSVTSHAGLASKDVTIGGNATVLSSTVKCGSIVAGNARVTDNSVIEGESKVFGNAQVATSKVSGASIIEGDARVASSDVQTAYLKGDFECVDAHVRKDYDHGSLRSNVHDVQVIADAVQTLTGGRFDRVAAAEALSASIEQPSAGPLDGLER